MLDIPSRQRPLVLLVSVVLVQVLLLAFQIKRGRDVRLIRVWSVGLLTPLQSAGTFVLSKVSGTWHGYVDLRHARSEDEALRAEVAQLQLSNQRLESAAAEAQRLAKLLGFRQQYAAIPMVAAEVIGASADPTSHTVFINRGKQDGLHRNLAVITPDGVVGKIVEAFSDTAQVLLVTDKESGVGSLLADTRAHGVVKGTGGPVLWMDYVVNEEKVRAGEQVLTSGLDRIFPKDLPVGVVISARAGNPFQRIQVEPAAHLDRLEEVLVLLGQQELAPKQNPAPASGSRNPARPASVASPPAAVSKPPAAAIAPKPPVRTKPPVTH